MAKVNLKVEQNIESVNDFVENLEKYGPEL